MKQASPLDYKANLVFVMPVLAVEFYEHRFQSRSVRSHVDNVGGHVPAIFLEAVDFARIRFEDLVGRRVRSDLDVGSPPLILDTEAGQALSHLIFARNYSILVGYVDCCHLAASL